MAGPVNLAGMQGTSVLENRPEAAGNQTGNFDGHVIKTGDGQKTSLYKKNTQGAGVVRGVGNLRGMHGRNEFSSTNSIFTPGKFGGSTASLATANFKENQDDFIKECFGDKAPEPGTKAHKALVSWTDRKVNGKIGDALRKIKDSKKGFNKTKIELGKAIIDALSSKAKLPIVYKDVSDCSAVPLVRLILEKAENFFSKYPDKFSEPLQEKIRRSIVDQCAAYIRNPSIHVVPSRLTGSVDFDNSTDEIRLVRSLYSNEAEGGTDTGFREESHYQNIPHSTQSQAAVHLYENVQCSRAASDSEPGRLNTKLAAASEKYQKLQEPTNEKINAVKQATDQVVNNVDRAWTDYLGRGFQNYINSLTNKPGADKQQTEYIEYLKGYAHILHGMMGTAVSKVEGFQTNRLDLNKREQLRLATNFRYHNPKNQIVAGYHLDHMVTPPSNGETLSAITIVAATINGKVGSILNAGQAPGESDISKANFLRTALANNIQRIVNLNQEQETRAQFLDDGSRVGAKWSPYYSMEPGGKVKFDNMTVETCKIQKDDSNGVDIYSLAITEEGVPGKQYIKVMHYTKWPDKTIVSTSEMNKILDRMSVIHKNGVEESVPSTEILIHCSAGIGRTGTLIANSRIKEYLEQHDDVASITFEELTDVILSTVFSMRHDRSHMMIQVPDQLCSLFEFAMDTIAQKRALQNADDDTDVPSYNAPGVPGVQDHLYENVIFDGGNLEPAVSGQQTGGSKTGAKTKQSPPQVLAKPVQAAVGSALAPGSISNSTEFVNQGTGGKPETKPKPRTTGTPGTPGTPGTRPKPAPRGKVAGGAVAERAKMFNNG